MDYTTVASLRGYLDQVEVSTTTDEVLGDIVTRASATVRTSLRSLLADSQFDFAADYAAATTQIITSYGGMVLLLPPHLAGSVTQVEYQASSNPTTWAAIADEWYEQQDGALYRSYGWGYATAYGRHAHYDLRYRVTAQWGYGDVPAEIEQVTLELSKTIWFTRDNNGVVGVEGEGALRITPGLTKSQRDTLKEWTDTVRQVAV